MWQIVVSVSSPHEVVTFREDWATIHYEGGRPSSTPKRQREHSIDEFAYCMESLLPWLIVPASSSGAMLRGKFFMLPPARIHARATDSRKTCVTKPAKEGEVLFPWGKWCPRRDSNARP